MKPLVRLLFILLPACSVFASADLLAFQAAVDWPTYIAKQDLHWDSVPQLWDEAPFVGNGVMGSMVFQSSENQLTIQIGRGDAQEHRTASGKGAIDSILPDSSRLPVGHFTLNTVGKITGCDLRLNLWDAEITGTIATDRGELKILSFIHSERNLLVVKAAANQTESGFTYQWHPEQAFCSRIKGKRVKAPDYRAGYDGNPDPVVESFDDFNICTQELTGGGQTATTWIVKTKENTKTLLASMAHTYPELTARQKAETAVKTGSDISLNELLSSHRVWWHSFYPKSFVSLPDARMESFFWIQHYKMACATKGGKVLADNQGVWLQPTGWPGLWWNLNVQLAYSHLLTSNHPELAEGLVNRLHKYRENLASNVPEHMQSDSAAINTISGQDLLAPIGDPLDPKQKRILSTGNLVWAMHNCYMQYRYTMDEEMLREKIFPLLKRSINYYRHFLIEGKDGKLHLPKTQSPEYGNVRDCTYDLSLLRWGCEALIECCDVLDVDDPLLPKWKEILDRLTPYPVDETGLMIGAGVPYERSHRHYSHLMMLYPLSTMDLDDPAERELGKKSLLHWQSYPRKLAGYSYTGSSSMFSLLGDGKMAEQRMQDFFEDKILPNTFYKEGSPVIETPLAGARSIEDMLIQSWSGKIVVFPAIPKKWQDVAFADLRTEGAFLVSASRKNGRTDYVSISSLAGASCRVQTGIPGKLKVTGIDKSAVSELGDGLVEIRLPKGAQVTLADADYAGNYTVGPVEKPFYSDWSWGKRK